MGKDIHVVLERKTAQGWEYFDSGFEAYDGRNHDFFEFVDDICDPGCPEELNHKRLRKESYSFVDGEGRTQVHEYFEWNTMIDDYLFGFEYITLDKLIREARRRDRVWISEEFYEAFIERGGFFPRGMHVGYGKSEYSDGTVGVEILDDYNVHLQDYIENGIRELKEIAKREHLEEDELRICFAFDW